MLTRHNTYYYFWLRFNLILLKLQIKLTTRYFQSISAKYLNLSPNSQSLYAWPELRCKLNVTKELTNKFGLICTCLKRIFIWHVVAFSLQQALTEQITPVQRTFRFRVTYGNLIKPQDKTFTIIIKVSSNTSSLPQIYSCDLFFPLQGLNFQKFFIRG